MLSGTMLILFRDGAGLPSFEFSCWAAISSKAEVAVQCRQARHSHGHGTGMAREVNG